MKLYFDYLSKLNENKKNPARKQVVKSAYSDRIIESRLTEDPISDWDYGDSRYSGPSLQKNKRAMSDVLAKVDYMIHSGKSPIFIAEYISTEMQHDKEMFRTHYEYTGDWEHFKKEYTKVWDKVLDYINLAKVSGSEDSDWVVNIGDLIVTFSRGTKLGVISNPRNIASAVKAQMIGNEAPTSKEDARELVINAVTDIISAMRRTSLSESKKIMNESERRFYLEIVDLLKEVLIEECRNEFISAIKSDQEEAFKKELADLFRMAVEDAFRAIRKESIGL